MPSIAVRFGATFAANLLRAAFSFAGGLIVARGLKAAHYGDLFFLLGSFAAISQLFDMGTSTAFYTLVARRRRSRWFIIGYLGWLACQFALMLLAVGILLPDDLVAHLWLGHDRAVVLLACAASFLTTQAWGVVAQLGEAVRRTVVVQTVWLGQAVAHLLLVSVLSFLGWLTVPTMLWLLVAEYIAMAVLVGPWLARENVAGASDASAEPGAVVQELLAYCKPLILYGWVSCFYTFADRWLLQRFGGSLQQGFFAIAQQFANVTLIATTSLLNIFWKEVAEAGERHDAQRLRALYATVSRGLYAFGAWCSCLVIPYSREVLHWTVGSGYEAAWPCLALMLFYPIHQSLGQINGTYLYATGETRRASAIGLVVMALSLPVTYLLLASPSNLVPGFGLGAIGLAVKMVTLQLVGVSLQGYIIARAHGWTYGARSQALVLAALLVLGWACRGIGWALAGAIGMSGHSIVRTILGGLAYVGGSFLLVIRVPAVIGFTREDLRRALYPLAKWLPQPAIAKLNL